MLCQSVASHAHVVSSSQVVSPNVASKRGITLAHVASLTHAVSGSQVASPDVASKRGVTCPRGVRERGGAARCGVKTWRHLPTRRGFRGPCGVARCGIKMWRQAATWHCWSCTRVHANAFTWRHGTWHQNVASLAHMVSENSESHMASPDVASKRGVRRHRCTRHRKTWRQCAASRGPGLSASVFKTCLQSSGDMCSPTGDPLFIYVYLQIHVRLFDLSNYLSTDAYTCAYVYLNIHICRRP